MVRNKIKLYFLAISLLAFLLGFTTGFLLTPRPGKAIWSRVITARILPPLWLEVAPMGYPQVGQSWNIFVYEVDTSSGTANLRPSISNSTVEIALKLGRYKQVYFLSVDEKGQTSFQYLPEYDDIAFQAFCGELSSQTVVISKHYVSSEAVNSLSTFNAFMSVMSGLTSGLAFRHRKFVKAASLLVFCLFAFVTFSSLYVKYFSETIWGYPEDIVSGVVTMTLLKYISYIGVVSIAVLWVVSGVMELRSSKKRKG